MEHLALEIFDLATKETPNPTGSQFAVLEPDATITITDTSEIFADGDVWSYDFTLNVHANAHLFGTAGDIHGSRLHEQINKRKARLWVEGVPLYLGYLKLGDEAEVDAEGNVDVSFESGQKTFDEMIDGAKANQVPMMSDVSIGMALWRKRVASCTLRLQASAKLKNGENTPYNNVFLHIEPHSGTIGQDVYFSVDGEEDEKATQQYPQMVFPRGSFKDIDSGRIRPMNCINTDYPYDDQHPYCNVALCYQRQGYEKKQKDGSLEQDYTSEPEAQRGYDYMPANRVNSAPNFFVIYWIKALMKHLGIYIEENQMMDVEDLRRMFFVNTRCSYEEPMYLRTAETDSRYGKYSFEGKRLIPEYYGKCKWKKSQGSYYDSYRRDETINREESKLECTEYTVGQIDTSLDPSEIPEIDKIIVEINEIEDWDSNKRRRYEQDNSYLHEAFASKDCFPNVDISEVIKAIENGFGVRFLFSNDYRRVRIVLLRNVFSDTDIQDVVCEIFDEDVKVENCIRGFRMTYGNTEDTQFYYKGFADKLPHIKTLWPDESDKHDYSHWSLNTEYASLIDKVSAFDKTCYVTPCTGNAYIVKVDKDAKRYDEQHPSLFGCADFMDAEDGDCTGEPESISEINMGFMPAIMNDVNWEKRRGDKSVGPLYALFVDEQMRPRRPELEDGVDYNDPEAEYKIYSDPNAAKGNDKGLYGDDSKAKEMKDGDIVKPGEFFIMSDMSVEQDNLRANVSHSLYKTYSDGHGSYKRVKYTITWPLTFSINGYINEGYRLYLQDNYDPNDDGIAPVEKHDWGLTIGIMRGSGSDAYVNYTADPDDGHDNDTWDIVPGSSVSAHPDTCDSYGKQWDYNGSTHVGTRTKAIEVMQEQWPDSNFNLTDRTQGNYLTGTIVRSVMDNKQKIRKVMLANRTSGNITPKFLGENSIQGYLLRYLSGKSVEEMYASDAGAKGVLIEVDSSKERSNTLLKLQKKAFGETDEDVVIDNGTGTTDGRFSLKLRAEKPNPYFDQSLPNIVTTKTDAGKAMKSLFKTANTDLLVRPKVSGVTMRAAGWSEFDGDYATLYSMGNGVAYSDGKVHEILWTPIRENGTVLSPSQLQSYIDGFNGLSASAIASHDTQHLILDIDTTDSRAELLHQLQAIYYAGDGETAPAVNIGNQRYLEIANKNLRHRGLCDQFYKEYSYWIRNARIVKRTVRMTLAQLQTIDKTKRVRVGDVTGFIRKMQYSVSNATGLGNVILEIMYI